jgi:hypothetical protein
MVAHWKVSMTSSPRVIFSKMLLGNNYRERKEDKSVLIKIFLSIFCIPKDGGDSC